MNTSLDLRHARELVELGLPVCHDEPLSNEVGRPRSVDILYSRTEKDFRELPNVWEIRRSHRQPMNT